MKNANVLIFTLLTVTMLLFDACGGGGESPSSSNTVIEFDSKTKIPTLVVVMNWNDYSETDATLWHDKIFSKSTTSSSVNLWYYDTTTTNIELVPVSETSGIVDDGVIFVDMKKNHPYYNFDVTSGYDQFRDIEIYNAITSSEVNSSVDFAALDKNGNGYLDFKELQILFVVSGGEQAYGDRADSRSIWAHSYSFEDGSAPVVDGVKLMCNSTDVLKLNAYTAFGATHGIDDADKHKATKGIIAHELGHSLFNLIDLYDNGGGSGLGSYDIMSGGAWAQKTTDAYPGQTPTQFSVYSKIKSGVSFSLKSINFSDRITLKCSSDQAIKLETASLSEYFLIECRDSARALSDLSFYDLDSAFTNNGLFAVIYHVDESKTGNTEDGAQTEANHYKVAVVERDTTRLMTSTAGIEAQFRDVYTLGETLSSLRTKLYDSTATGYSVLVDDADYTNRTMTFSITR